MESTLPRYLFEALDKDEFIPVFDFDEIPIDAHQWEEDGDDSVLASHPRGLPPLATQSQLEPTTAQNMLWLPPSAEDLIAVPRVRAVEFARQFKADAQGQDVLAVKRALRAAGYKRVNATNSRFGPDAVSALKDFQTRKGLDPDGVYGKKTHAALMPFFDQRGIFLMSKAMEQEKNREQKGDIPHGIQACAMFQYNNRWVVKYTQSWLRMSGVRGNLHPPKIGDYEDCSSSYTWWGFDGGSPDPNGGTAFSGRGKTARGQKNPQGYTGTLIAHGRQAARKAMGAAGLYGSSFSHTKHVVAAIGTAGLCVSFGSYPTKVLEWNYRGDFLCWRTYW